MQFQIKTKQKLLIHFSIAKLKQSSHKGKECNEAKELLEIAEEVASSLEYACPHVTSVVCPSLTTHHASPSATTAQCQLGVAANEIGTCPSEVHDTTTRNVMHELQKATRKHQGCPTAKQVLCTRSNDANRWMSCVFLSGGGEGQLPVGQVPVHDSL